DRPITWRELEATSNRLARLLAERATANPGLVVVGLPNCPLHYFATYAAWKLGACVLPMRWDVPPWERNRMLDVANPTFIVADWTGVSPPVINPAHLLEDAMSYSDDSLADRIPNPAVAIGSSGSTGRPKVVRTPKPGAAIPGAAVSSALTGWGKG